MKHLFLKTAFILTTSIAFAQVPTNGLVGYWPFNGNANDASGNNINGVVNGTSLTTDRFGNSNAAYLFNGTSSVVTIPNSASFSTENWTVSAWYKTSNNGLQRITTKQLTQNGSNYMSIVMNNGLIYGTSWIGGSEIKSLDKQTSNDNTWHHVVYTRNTAKNKYYLYQDGILKDSITDTFGTLANSANFLTGSSFSGTQYWNGSLDDIRVYNRVLSQKEVYALYNENVCFKTISVSDTLRISMITGLNELTDHFGTIKIFPNPTNDVLNISVSNPSPNYTIKITSSTSQTLFTTQLTTSSYQLNLNTLGAKGLYFIQILDNTNKVLETKKLVLE